MQITGNHIKIKDLVKLNLVNMVRVKDNFVSAANPNTNIQKGLLVRIAATHSGIVNRNNMFYLPDRMRNGVSSFTDQFPKPVLLNHDDMSDPIGRIIAAKYVDTSHLVKDRYKGKSFKDSLTKKEILFDDKLLDSFLSGEMGYGAQVDYARSISDSILDDPSYEGMGYAEIVANITDQEAATKFLDGRYLTGSVGASTDRAVCSNCKQDWTQDGMCDHKLGKVYDGKKTYLVAGNFSYDEWSVANKPADRHAKALELNYNGVKDSVTIDDNDFSGRIYEVKVESLKEEDMKLKDTEGAPVVEPVKEVAPVVVAPPVKDAIPETELSFDDFITRVLDSTKGDLSDTEDEKLYALMLDEMKAEGLSEKEIEDAKLSTEKRKSLSKSTFCGPGRSFPVPDCAHVTAARRLIGRFKGDKAGILSCVDRKAKAMGCGTMKDKVEGVKDDAGHAAVLQALLNALSTNQYAADSEALDPKDLAALQNVISKLAAMVTEDSFSAALLADDAKLAKKFKLVQDTQLLDEIASLETKLGDLKEEFKKVSDSQVALKEEYTLATKEAELLQDEVVKTKSSLRALKVDHLTLYKNLKSGKVDGVVVDNTTSDATLDSELATLVKEVDIKKITDKLSDGTSRKPNGTVEDPTVVEDKKKLDATQIKDRLNKINEIYTEMRFKNQVAANRWLEDQMTIMKMEGLLPNDSK